MKLSAAQGLYDGAACWLCVGGPSLQKFDPWLFQVPGFITVAINNAAAVVRPDLMICCDRSGQFPVGLWQDPRITKILPGTRKREQLFHQDAGEWKPIAGNVVDDHPNTLYFLTARRFDHKTYWKSDRMPWGCASGQKCSVGLSGVRSTFVGSFWALHQLGIKHVYLVGCDWEMGPDQPYAWAQGKSPGACKSNNRGYDVNAKRLAAIEDWPMTVHNCLPDSKLDVFPYIDPLEAVRKHAIPEAAYDPTNHYDGPHVYAKKKKKAAQKEAEALKNAEKQPAIPDPVWEENQDAAQSGSVALCRVTEAEHVESHQGGEERLRDAKKRLPGDRADSEAIRLARSKREAKRGK